MENRVVNKQIPVKKIIDVANYLEDCKDRYDNTFRQEEIKNKDLPYNEKNYEYANGNTRMNYTIEFYNGQTMTESDYNWFIGNLNEPRLIKNIRLNLYIGFSTRSQGSDYNDIINNIDVYVDFRDHYMNDEASRVTISIDAKNQERESNNIYSTILNMLEDNEERYNKTIKYRKIRIQSLCISVGIILSYILYIILKINIAKLPEIMATYMSNKYVLVFGQWFVSILLGNVFAYWYILSVYRPLLPSTKYAGYNKSTYKSVYTDDIDTYLDGSEVHFGKYWDAERRRNLIEKIYKITRIIVLVQLLISVILFLILK